MKLIIDIPEETYREVIEGKDTSNTNIYNAIEKGTPFNCFIKVIRAEIFNRDAAYVPNYDAFEEVFEIIDKHFSKLEGGTVDKNGNVWIKVKA